MKGDKQDGKRVEVKIEAAVGVISASSIVLGGGSFERSGGDLEVTGGSPSNELPDQLSAFGRHVSLEIHQILIPEKKVPGGTLVKATGALWAEIVKEIGKDWDKAYQLSSDQWEELIAGAYDKAGYDEVILTPRSSDHGRDVIATKKGFGTVKVINSVKAYAPTREVSYDDIRSLMGVVLADPDVSKGMLSTTSHFPRRVMKDPFISAQIPSKLELMDGVALKEFLDALVERGDHRELSKRDEPNTETR